MITPQALALLGLVQGLFLFIAILGRGWRRLSNYSLAALALLIALRLLPTVLIRLPESLSTSGLRLIFDSFIFLFGPLLWLYIGNLTGKALSATELKHLLPFVIIFITGLVSFGNIRQVMFVASGIAVYPYIAAYQAVMVFKLRRFARTARDYVSNPERVGLIWFRMLLIGSVTLLLASLAADLASIVEKAPRWIELLPFISADILLFEITYLAIRHPESDPEIDEARRQIADSPAPAESELRYTKNRLGDSTERKILSRIIEYTEKEEPFRNDELRLSDLANMLGFPAHTISMVLNIHQNENFYQFINRYRVEAVKAALADPNRASESILNIAFDSGFRSKSTFNSVFRELTGKTPGKFRSG